MARILTSPDELLVVLSPVERLLALHGDVRVPLRAVREVRVRLEDAGLDELLAGSRDAAGAAAALRAAARGRKGHGG